MADWRLFTEQDFQQSLFGRDRTVLEQFAQDRVGNETSTAILADTASLRKAVEQLRFRLTRDRSRTQFEHGVSVGIKSKTPRGHQWRTYCLSESGTLLGLLTIRGSEAYNLCEVDVFLAAEFPELPRGEITRRMLRFLLTDSIRTVGRTKVQFSSYCFNQQVPPTVVAEAASLGISIKNARQGQIHIDEGRELAVRLLGLTESARNRVRTMSDRGGPTVERICYLVESGVWSLREIQYLLSCSACPEQVLTNSRGVGPDVLSTQADYDARSAILGEYVARTLSRCDVADEPDDQGNVERGGYERRIRCKVIAKQGVIRYRLGVDAALPGWCRDSSRYELPANRVLTAFLRPYDLAGLETELEADLRTARTLASRQTTDPIAVVVPKDFDLLTPAIQHRLENIAGADVRLLLCPLKTATIASEVRDRIRKGQFICR